SRHSARHAAPLTGAEEGALIHAADESDPVALRLVVAGSAFARLLRRAIVHIERGGASEDLAFATIKLLRARLVAGSNDFAPLLRAIAFGAPAAARKRAALRELFVPAAMERHHVPAALERERWVGSALEAKLRDSRSLSERLA